MQVPDGFPVERYRRAGATDAQLERLIGVYERATSKGGFVRQVARLSDGDLRAQLDALDLPPVVIEPEPEPEPDEPDELDGDPEDDDTDAK